MPLKPPITDCECSGHGYDVFHCDGLGHTPVEIQRNDACRCLEERTGWDKASDDVAAVAFVRDLERGDEHAQRCAQDLLDCGDDVQRPDPFECDYCPRCGNPAHASESDDRGVCVPCIEAMDERGPGIACRFPPHGSGFRWSTIYCSRSLWRPAVLRALVRFQTQPREGGSR